MDCEKQTTEYKSLLKIRTGDKGFKDLSVTCVALANAQGGRIFIGYDDKKKAPLPEQHITPDEVNEAVTKLRSLCFNVGLVASEICTDDTDRLEISNPGGLPLGITKDNILHAKHRRNPNMIELLSALEMMEGEGSGYDLIYQLNAMEAKDPPMIESSYNEVTVIQNAEIIDTELLPLLDFVLQNYQLTQKALTAFGIIAREKKVFSTRLSAMLQLQEEERLRSYTDKLLKDNIIGRNGAKKGTQFFVNPQLIKNAKVNLKTTLKTVEPYVLRTLIMEDLRAHPKSKISEIASRLPEIDLQELRKMVYSMVDVELITEGARTDRRYTLK